MDARELAVERDALLQGGRTPEEVEAGQLAMGKLTPWQVAIFASFSAAPHRRGPDKAGEQAWRAFERLENDILEGSIDAVHVEAQWYDAEWMARRARARVTLAQIAANQQAALSLPENQTGASAPHPVVHQWGAPGNVALCGGVLDNNPGSIVTCAACLAKLHGTPPAPVPAHDATGDGKA